MTRLLPPRRASQVVDLAVAVLMFIIGLGSWARGEPVPKIPIALLSLAMCAALMLRRRRPTVMFAVVAGAIAMQYALGVRPRSFDLPLVVATYSVAAYAPRSYAVAALIVDMVGALMAGLRWSGPRHILLGVVAAAAALTAVWVVGDNMRTRRAYLAGLEERAARLEAERDAQTRLAAAAERARIAREMHDVVAHSLSVVIAQADGAQFAVDRSPERAKAAMATVAATGRAALDEMRRLLGVLRGAAEDAQLAPQPGIDGLGELVAAMRDAGLTVELDQAGEPDGLPDGLSLTVFRIVQEALTNTLKHAGVGARVQLRLSYRADSVQIDVVDDGAGRFPAAAAAGSGGHGLAGMRERVALYGGSLTAGPTLGGGWELHVRLRQLVGV
jgi:signal transduction histidine kinase